MYIFIKFLLAAAVVETLTEQEDGNKEAIVMNAVKDLIHQFSSNIIAALSKMKN